MSDYTQSIDFSAKDALASGNAAKVAKGADLDTELSLISTAIATKYDSTNLASQAVAEAGASNVTLMTPLRTEQWSAVWAAENGGLVGDIQALTDPGADRILFWDDGAGAAAFLTISTGLTLSGTNLTSNDSAIVHDNLSGFVANEHINHTSVTLTAGNGLTGGGDISANRTFTVVGGNGLTANANDVAITNASVSTTVPVGFSSGAMTWDSSSITELGIGAMSQSADGFLVDDAGVLKVMPYDEAGIKVASVADTTDTLALTDMNTFIEYTSASAVTVTLNNSVGALGNIIIIKQTGAGQVSLAGTATLQGADTATKTRTTDSVMSLVCLVEGASAEWAVFGDTTV